ncbi:Acetyl-CoA hydrolase/transferase C-terminal domain-containing protein [Paraburkholderia sacchari]|uniref:acetyl-CoA hydrolase/transferase family protein n=1 Tax=Paraburkholderia sacchari TaxID=159450 RepID=UPI0039A5962C
MYPQPALAMAAPQDNCAPAILSDRGRRVEPDSLPRLVRPNGLVFVPGSSGAPSVFMTELLSKNDLTRDARLLTTYVPGINRLDLSSLHPTGQVTGLFMQPGLADAQRAGHFRTLPLSYGGFVRYLVDHVDIDLAVVQVSEPDEVGQCSLGPAVEFSQIALSRSRRRLALVNRNTPRIQGAVSVPYSSFDFVCEVDSALPVYSVGSDACTDTIAAHIASLIDDGCALQIGLGKVPAALTRLVRDRRNLRLYSGMLSDGLFDLDDAGALDPDFAHTACVLVGSDPFYRRLSDFPSLRVLGCETTHDPRTLVGLERFVTVNSALEVDLFGQSNLEHANGSAISGAGGAPDFARAGRLSAGGCSIVALNATHGKGSRIVPYLSNHAVASLPRIDVDYVITEFGIARLTGASVHERAEAIIGVAAPEYREELTDSWRAIAARL